MRDFSRGVIGLPVPWLETVNTSVQQFPRVGDVEGRMLTEETSQSFVG